MSSRQEIDVSLFKFLSLTYYTRMYTYLEYTLEETDDMRSYQFPFALFV
jgi:hypothetical protein